jgi:hypothetical protein
VVGTPHQGRKSGGKEKYCYIVDGYGLAVGGLGLIQFSSVEGVGEGGRRGLCILQSGQV